MSNPREEPPVNGDDGADELEAAWFERLLDVPDADGVPATYEALAAVLLSLRSPGDEDLDGEAAAIGVFRSCHRGGSLAPAGSGRARTAKTLTIAVALSLATATGAVAATGRLPADIQDMAAELLEKVGIRIPAAPRTHDTDALPPDGPPAEILDPVTPAPVSGGSLGDLPHERAGGRLDDPGQALIQGRRGRGVNFAHDRHVDGIAIRHQFRDEVLAPTLSHSRSPSAVFLVAVVPKAETTGGACRPGGWTPETTRLAAAAPAESAANHREIVAELAARRLLKVDEFRLGLASVTRPLACAAASERAGVVPGVRRHGTACERRSVPWPGGSSN